MGFFDFLRGGGTPPAGTRTYSDWRNTGQEVADQVTNKFYGEFSAWGGSYTPYGEALDVYLRKGWDINPDLYSVVNFVVTKSVQAPMYVKQEKATGRGRKYREFRRARKGVFVGLDERMALLAKAQEGTVTEVESHPFLDLMDTPNEYQTRSEFLYTVLAFLKLTGNAYIWKQKLITGKVKYMYVLPSNYVRIKTGEEGTVTGYKLVHGNQELEYKADEVIHIKYPNLNYGRNGQHFYGSSPLLAHRRTLQASNEGIDRLLDILANGGVFGFISNDSDNAPLTPVQATALHEKLKDADRAYARKKEKLARYFVTNGTIKFVQVGLKPDELNVQELNDNALEKFCRAYGMNPMVMTLDKVTRDNFRVAWRQTITQGIAPDLQKLEEAFSKDPDLFPDGRWVEFDVSEFEELREDLKDMVTTLSGAWWLTINQRLYAMGYPMDEDPACDRRMVPVGYQFLDDMDTGDDEPGTNDYNY